MDLRKEFAFTIISALVGIMIGYFLKSMEGSQPVNYYILAVIALMIILALLCIGPIRLILSSPKGIKISGKWNAEWHYMKGDKTVKVKELIIIKQYGRYIKGAASSTKIQGSFPLEKAESVLEGEIHPDGIIQGSWWSKNESERYKGKFQGMLKVSGNTINAKWLGRDSTGINTGEWIWKRG